MDSTFLSTVAEFGNNLQEVTDTRGLYQRLQ